VDQGKEKAVSCRTALPVISKRAQFEGPDCENQPSSRSVQDDSVFTLLPIHESIDLSPKRPAVRGFGIRSRGPSSSVTEKSCRLPQADRNFVLGDRR
jgi:hypothetical protein